MLSRVFHPTHAAGAPNSFAEVHPPPPSPIPLLDQTSSRHLPNHAGRAFIFFTQFHFHHQLLHRCLQFISTPAATNSPQLQETRSSSLPAHTKKRSFTHTRSNRSICGQSSIFFSPIKYPHLPPPQSSMPPSRPPPLPHLLTTLLTASLSKYEISRLSRCRHALLPCSCLAMPLTPPRNHSLCPNCFLPRLHLALIQYLWNSARALQLAS